MIDMTEPPDLNVRILEAMIFASAEPVSEKVLARLLPEGASLAAALKELKAHYAGRGVNLVKAGKSWAFRTALDLGRHLNREVEVGRKLSRAAVETLAIIAYHQPVTRGEIEEIRGVGLSKGTLDNLFAAGWIGPRGRRRTPGRPVIWATTDGFLDHFGLEAIGDLPGMEDLKAAGLLDPRPAIESYSNRGEMSGPSVKADGKRQLPVEVDEGNPVFDKKAEEEEIALEADGGKPEEGFTASGAGPGRGLAAAGTANEPETALKVEPEAGPRMEL
jgi:segregation and condensation protein B